MHAEESAATRRRQPVLLVDCDDARWHREAIAEAALGAGLVAHTAASAHRACVQLARPEERALALVAFADAARAAAVLDLVRAVRGVRPTLPILLATPDAASAAKLRGEVDAAGLPSVHFADADPDALVRRLQELVAVR